VAMTEKVLNVNESQASDAKTYLKDTFEESMALKVRFFEEYGPSLIAGAKLLGETLKNGKKILICGNGGSAADSQHMAAELVGRMLLERRPLAALALTTDSSNLTAIGNDYGYDYIFSKQVQGLGQKGDCLVAISTSGNSKNVVLAAEEAKKIGMTLITLTGGTGGKLHAMGDVTLNVSLAKNSSRTQESHIFAIHSLVDLMDRYFLPQI